MKVMLGSGDEGDGLRFIDEAKITGQLDHPNIVPIYERGVDEQDQLFYTMKLVRGITLKKVLELLAGGVEATTKKFPLPALLTIFQKACDARMPEGLLAVCRQALAHDKTHRYASVEDLQRDLTAYQNGFATSVERASFGKQLLLAVRRHKAVALGVAAVLLVGSVLGTKAILEGRRAEREAAAAKATLADLRRTAPVFYEQAKLFSTKASSPRQWRRSATPSSSTPRSRTTISSARTCSSLRRKSRTPRKATAACSRCVRRMRRRRPTSPCAKSSSRKAAAHRSSARSRISFSPPCAKPGSCPDGAIAPISARCPTALSTLS